MPVSSLSLFLSMLLEESVYPTHICPYLMNVHILTVNIPEKLFSGF